MSSIKMWFTGACLVLGLTVGAQAQLGLPGCGGEGERPCFPNRCDSGLVKKSGKCRPLVDVAQRNKPVCHGKCPGEDIDQPPLPETGELARAVLALHDQLDEAQPCNRGMRQTIGGEPITLAQLNDLQQQLDEERALLEVIHHKSHIELAAMITTGQLDVDADNITRISRFLDDLQCAGMGPSSEPDCDCDVTPVLTGQGEPLQGFADLHAHPFSNHAFGGLVMWGEVFHERGIESALPLCDFSGELEPGADGLLDMLLSVTGKSDEVIDNEFASALLGTPVHGHGGELDFFGDQTLSEAFGNPSTTHPSSNEGLNVSGAKWMGAWPSWDSLTHQQMYYRWLERAWRGGLRLMVMHAVNNELVCSVYPRLAGNDCSDSLAVDLQLAATRELEAFIDRQHGGDGWFRIVESAAEARTAVQQGKLAVVLGVEVDSLFECSRGDCTRDDVRKGVADLSRRGVRHVIPIHLFDNDFGGAAIYKEKIAMINQVLAFSVDTGSISSGRTPATSPDHGGLFDRMRNRVTHMELRNCSAEGYGVVVEQSPKALCAELEKRTPSLEPGLQMPSAQPSTAEFCRQQTASCNALGLTDLGRFLVRELMAAGMVIDLDHMSALAKDDTLDLAEAVGVPVMSGHSEFTGAVIRRKRSERALTPGELQRIVALGGVVSAKMLPMRASEVVDAGWLEDDCDFSAKNWAQVYAHLVDAQGGPRRAAVALGSDFNGMITHAAPRFGDDACGGGLGGSDNQPQQTRIRYPFESHLGEGQFQQQRTGQRSFDYNTDGLAHVGLLPDFVEDLKASGMDDEQLAPLFRSAEAYIAMWEKIEAQTEPGVQVSP